MWFDDLESRCLVIAEVAQNHDGSVGTAHAYVESAAKAGADAVKFQTHIASAESTPEEPWRVKFSPQDASRYAYWKRMEFTEVQWRGLAEHAAERGLVFLSSAFSMEAVDLLERVGVSAWKVGSGEVTNLPMIERMAGTGKPVLLSSGMSAWRDLDAAVEAVRRRGAPVAVLQCTSAYPCPPEQIGLNVMGELRQRYGCPVGLSDHSGTVFAGLAAAALGVFSRECFGPDVPASITTAELAHLVEGVRFVERALSHPVDKEAMSRELAPMRSIFQKSLVAARDLPEGWVLREADLVVRKPGTGLPASSLKQVVNSRLKRALRANALLSEQDLER
jgi:N-acetylneuraminate synthase